MRVFVPQTTLEEWALEDTADLKDGRLVFSGEPQTYPIVPAVHFLTLVNGSDERGLVARVKTEPQLAGMGAEHMADSVLFGEDAYEVVPGYVAEVPPPAAAQKTEKHPTTHEADLLAAFILNKL